MLLSPLHETLQQNIPFAAVTALSQPVPSSCTGQQLGCSERGSAHPRVHQSTTEPLGFTSECKKSSVVMLETSTGSQTCVPLQTRMHRDQQEQLLPTLISPGLLLHPASLLFSTPMWGFAQSLPSRETVKPHRDRVSQPETHPENQASCNLSLVRDRIAPLMLLGGSARLQRSQDYPSPAPAIPI